MRGPRAAGSAHLYRVGAVVLGLVLLILVVRRRVVSGDTLIYLGVLIPSVILHEISHGVVALACGDQTARRAGRLTLNPLPHIDPIGSVVVPVVMLLSSHGAFGWAKPVPVDVSKLRSPRNQTVLVALAGPLTNAVLALVAAVVFRATAVPGAISLDAEPLVARIVFFLGFANVLLAVLNLIPIPPLDGSAVIERLLPRAWWPGYLRLRSMSAPLVFGVMLVLLVGGVGVLDHVFDPALRLWQRLST